MQGTLNYTDGEGKIYATLLVQLCYLVTLRVLFFSARMKKKIISLQFRNSKRFCSYQ